MDILDEIKDHLITIDLKNKTIYDNEPRFNRKVYSRLKESMFADYHDYDLSDMVRHYDSEINIHYKIIKVHSVELINGWKYRHKSCLKF